MAVTIRSATPEDAEEMAPLLGELGYPSSPDDVSRRMSAMGAVEGTAVLVAADRGRVLGIATAQHLVVLHANGPCAQLMLLVVAETARHRGIGRELVAAAEGWARDRGCIRMLVACGENRTEAHAMYENLGYIHTARRYVKRLE